MATRKTIMVDDEIDKRLRSLQSKLIKKSSSSVSYSSVIMDVLDGKYKL